MTNQQGTTVAIHVRVPRDVYDKLREKQKRMVQKAGADVDFAAVVRAMIEAGLAS